MSLEFDFTAMAERLGQEEYDRITNHPTNDKEWNPVTNALIWATMYVGLGAITEKNVDTFVKRLLAVQAAGALLRGGEKEVYVTERDVRNHIGMRTNVTDEKAATFNAKLVRICIDEGFRHCRLQKHSAFDIMANPDLLKG